MSSTPQPATSTDPALPAPVHSGDGAGQPVPSPVPPPVAMLQLISGFWISRGIFAAARLGLPDLLREEPRTAEELAHATGTHAPSLYRLLRALASVDLFTEDEEGRFALTPLGATLRTDVPGSLRALAISELGLDHYQAWEHLLYSIRTGKIAFDHRFGMNVWDYYARHAENGRIFNQSMEGITGVLSESILASYDFSPFRQIVDVGGGKGHLLARILKQHPAARGILFDLPAVTPVAKQLLEAEGVAARSDVVTGDFFASVPEGGDAYVLKWIIHDWEDEKALAILKNCRRAIAADGKLLLIENVLRPGNAPALGKWADLIMLVMTGGRERTEAAFRTLLDAAGFRLTRVVPTESEMCVIEAVPA